MKRIVLRRHEPGVENGWHTTRMTIETPGLPRRQFWYRVSMPEGWRLTEASDPFVPVPLLDAMRRNLPLHVEGDVSPSFFANLEEFQRFWVSWYRGRFTPVEISAEREREQPPGKPGAVMAFSAGLDSCFTAYRHAIEGAGRQTQSLLAGVMAHGFDIPIEENGFQEAADDAEAMLATLGIPLVRVATNVRHVEHAWDDVVGAAVGSILHLLQPNARVGLIPGSYTPDLQELWGSNSLSDPLLSTTSFRVIHDSQCFTRPDKIKGIAEWPAALEGLRVCYHNPQRNRNCGRCGKCLRTMVTFRALGLSIPPCFDRVPDDSELLKQPPLPLIVRPLHRMIVDATEQAPDAPTARTIRKVWRREKRREVMALATAQLRRTVLRRGW